MMFRSLKLPAYIAVTLLSASVLSLNFKPCLNNSVRAQPVLDEEGNIKQLRIGAGNWDSAIILGRIVQIIMNEGVGVPVDFDHSFSASAEVMRNLTGCLDKDCNEVDEAYAAFPHVHFDFESWFMARPSGLKLVSRANRLVSGLIGFDGQEGIFMKREISKRAWEEYKIPIAYYLAMQHPDHDWMSLFTKARNIRIPLDGGCRGEKADAMNNFGLHCEHDGWWYSPACEHNKDHCIPVLFAANPGWLGPEAALLINFTHVPMAVTFLDWPHELVSNGSVSALFYWWRPDWTYSAVGEVDRVIFPSHSRYSWRQGIFETDLPDFNLNKYMWPGVPKLSYKLSKLFDAFSFSYDSLDALMSSVLVQSNEDDFDIKFKVACDWVKDNQHVWRGWYPDIEPCAPGFGRDAFNSTCIRCKPGRMSMENYDDLTRDYVCRNCSNGTMSASYGATSCEACDPGRFSKQSGQSLCIYCPIGRYSATARSNSCESCEGELRQSSTLYRGAALAEACTCPAGTRHNGTACKPCEKHLWCPGGFSKKDLVDATFKVEAGYMSMPDAPHSVYSCTFGNVRCPHSRSPFQSSNEKMCEENSELVPRCGACKDTFYDEMGGICTACSESSHGGVFLVLKCVFTLVLKLCFVLYLYTRFKRPQPSGIITMSGILGFVQALQAIGRMPLKWPGPLSSFFDFLDFFTLRGIHRIWQLKVDCLIGTGYLAHLCVDAIVPMTIFTDFFALYVMFRACGRRLQFKYVHNTVLLVFTNLFISITGLSQSLFFREVQPNGKIMVTPYPQLEYGSREWVSILPINFIATTCYGFTTLTYVTYIVWKAPLWAASMPDFSQRFRFCVGSFRADCWWWMLMQLAYGFTLNLIQAVAPATDVHRQIYLTLFGMVLFTTIEFSVCPWRFAHNNWSDLSFKGALIFLLMVATSFVNLEDISASERDYALYAYSIMAMLFIVCSLSLCIALITVWIVRALRPAHVRGAEVAKVGWRFRDVMTTMFLVPPNDFMERIASAQDHDLHSLAKAADCVVRIILQEQVSHRWRRQRVMPGVPYKVFDHNSTVVETLQSIESGLLQSSIAQGAVSRLKLLALARAMHAAIEKETILARMASTGSSKLVSGSISDNSGFSTTPSASHRLGLQKGSELSLSDFKEHLQNNFKDVDLDDDDITLLFDLIDTDGSGVISMDEFGTTILALAPAKLVKAWHHSVEMDKESVDNLDACIRRASARICDRRGTSAGSDIRHVATDDKQVLDAGSQRLSQGWMSHTSTTRTDGQDFDSDGVPAYPLDSPPVPIVTSKQLMLDWKSLAAETLGRDGVHIRRLWL